MIVLTTHFRNIFIESNFHSILGTEIFNLVTSDTWKYYTITILIQLVLEESLRSQVVGYSSLYRFVSRVY